MPFAVQSQEAEEAVEEVIRAQKDMERLRTNWESHWNDIANFVWPEMRNTFRPGQDSFQFPGTKKTQLQLDATPQLAMNQFGAIMDSLLTPRNQTWHMVGADNEELQKDHEVTLYFEAVNRLLFKHRYAPGANFASQNQLQYKGLGAFGTGVMFPDSQIDGRGIRYKNIHIGEIYIRENHQGVVNAVIRYYMLAGHKVITQFTEQELGEELFEDAKDKPYKEFAFMQYVRPNNKLDLTRLDFRGKKFASTTINVDRKWLIREGGFHVFPFIGSRFEQAPTETYGRGPAMMALPAVRTLNVQKSTQLKIGHRNADPVLLTHDDGLLDEVDITPGAINPGGVDQNGRLMVQTLPAGNYNVGLDMMDKEREIINSAFLVHLFQILQDNPRMTATEVIERTREKGILLAPTVGRQQSEYLGPLIDREIDVLNEQGLMPQMPGILVEAQGEFTLEYNSPLSRAMRAEEAAGVIRTFESILPIVNTTGDVSPLDNFDMDVVTRGISDIQAVPKRWMRTLEDVEAIRKGRAAEAERAQQAEEASGQAALISAEANAQGA